MTKNPKILRSKDENKDQSYFLWQIKSKNLDKILFPIGDFETKARVRQFAAENDLITAGKKDSQGLCFVGQTNVREMLWQILGQKVGLILAKTALEIDNNWDEKMDKKTGQKIIHSIKSLQKKLEEISENSEKIGKNLENSNGKPNGKKGEIQTIRTIQTIKRTTNLQISQNSQNSKTLEIQEETRETSEENCQNLNSEIQNKSKRKLEKAKAKKQEIIIIDYKILKKLEQNEIEKLVKFQKLFVIKKDNSKIKTAKNQQNKWINSEKPNFENSTENQEKASKNGENSSIKIQTTNLNLVKNEIINKTIKKVENETQNELENGVQNENQQFYKILNTHKGAFTYTIGQRQGLNLSDGPWFVQQIDIKNNLVIVTQNSQKEIYTTKILVKNLNWQNLPKNV